MVPIRQADGVNQNIISTHLVAPVYGFLRRGGEEFMNKAAEVSLIMHDIYSLDGFEKWTKAWNSQLRFISRIPAINGVFDHCMETLKFQIDLYYATLIINSSADFLENKNGEGRTRLKNINHIGNFFETGKFFQKYGIFSFSKCTEWSNHYGAFQVFGRRLDKVPVLEKAFDKPKDLIIFIISFAETVILLCDPVLHRLPSSLKSCFNLSTHNNGTSFLNDWEKRYKLIGHIGKLILISVGTIYGTTLAIGLVDLATQHSSLFGHILKKQKERDDRFNLRGAAA